MGVVETQENKGWLYFKYIVFNTGVSRFGTSAFNLVILWVILSLTKSPLLSGLGDGMLSLPLFFSFIFGALIERSKRRRMLAIIASALRSIAFIIVFVGLYLGNPILITLSIYAVAFLLGFTSDILNSIRATWTKQFLTEDQYKKGTSLSQTVSSLAEGVGFIASGLLLLLGFYKSFFTLMILFAIAVIPFILVRPVEDGVSQSVNSSLRESFSFIKTNKNVYQLMVIAFIANLIFGMSGILFTSFVQLHLKLTSEYLSAIFFMFIVGTVFGSAMGSKVKGKLGSVGIATFSISGLSIVSVSFINTYYLTFIPAFVIGLLIGMINVALNTTFLTIIPQELMARVSGAFTTFTLAATFFSGTIGGIVIEITSPTECFLYMGIAILLITPLFFVFKEFSRTVIK